MTNKTLGYLGLARRAGRLEIGEDGTCGAIRSRKAHDAAENSRRRATNLAEAHGIPVYTVSATKAELGHAVGRDLCAMLAVCDEGLARAAAQTLTDIPQTENQ